MGFSVYVTLEAVNHVTGTDRLGGLMLIEIKMQPNCIKYFPFSFHCGGYVTPIWQINKNGARKQHT